MQPSNLRILHSFPTWLPPTQTWMYNQIIHLPDPWQAHVVCRQTANLDAFGVPNLHAYEDSPAGRVEAAASGRFTRSLEDRRFAGLPLRRLKDAAYRAYQAHIIQDIRPDIFHSHFGNVAWMDLRAIGGVDVPHVATFYGYDVNFACQSDPRWRKRYAELFESVAAIFCEGPHMAERVVKLGCPRTKVHVQHLGVDLDKIEFCPRQRAEGEALRVLIAASFREKKGIPFALAALGQLRHQIQLQITVIGDASNDLRSQKEKQEILEVVSKYSLEKEVEFLGYVSHERLMREAYDHHIFVSPSVEARSGDTEGGAPVVLLEMMASGMPVLSTTHCDIPELIRHGESGLLAEERDVSGLIRHLQWLIEYPERWPKMLRAARSRVEAEFDVRIQGQRQAELYAQLLS